VRAGRFLLPSRRARWTWLYFLHPRAATARCLAHATFCVALQNGVTPAALDEAGVAGRPTRCWPQLPPSSSPGRTTATRRVRDRAAGLTPAPYARQQRGRATARGFRSSVKSCLLPPAPAARDITASRHNLQNRRAGARLRLQNCGDTTRPGRLPRSTTFAAVWTGVACGRALRRRGTQNGHQSGDDLEGWYWRRRNNVPCCIHMTPFLWLDGSSVRRIIQLARGSSSTHCFWPWWQRWERQPSGVW